MISKKKYPTLEECLYELEQVALEDVERFRLQLLEKGMPETVYKSLLLEMYLKRAVSVIQDMYENEQILSKCAVKKELMSRINVILLSKDFPE